MTKANSIEQIKPGQVVKIESKKNKEHRFNGKFKVVATNTFGEDITIQFPDGTKRVIDWVEFIIYILPLLE